MRLAVMTFAKSGVHICRRLQSVFPNIDVYLKEEMCDSKQDLVIGKPFRLFVGEIFQKYDGLIFIMATGIVVREIAPYLKSKKTDPAVIVIDDIGQHIIPLLSGHLGGANQLACRLAEIIGGKPVITTSTDLHQVPAFDLIAKELGMGIEGLENLKFISGALVNGEKVGLFTDVSLDQDLGEWVEEEGGIEAFQQMDASRRAMLISRWKGIVLITDCLITESLMEKWSLPVLTLRPKNLVVGMGFRRGKSNQELREALEQACLSAHVSFSSIGKIATIDLKGDEPGLHRLQEELAISVEIFSREEVRLVEDQFLSSSFVKQTIGVGAVAEPCAYLANQTGEWVLRKAALDGVTVAIRKGR